MRLYAAFRTIPSKRRWVLVAGLCASMLATAQPGLAAHEAPVILSPVPGAAINTGTVAIGGTSAGDVVLVRIYEGITVLGETGPLLGHWSASIPLADGSHTISVRGLDAGATWTAFSAPVTFTVDTVAPPPAGIASPADGAIVPYRTVTVEGSAEPGARVSVAISTGGAPVLVNANNAGNWEFTRPFSDAPHTLTATAIDAAGNQASPSPSITFTVDTLTPSAPWLDTPGTGAVVRPQNVLIAGRAEPGTLVRVWEGALIGATISTTAGRWSITHTFTEGEHTVVARAEDSAGHVSAASSMTFTVDTVAPPIPVILAPAEGAFVPHRYTVRGTAEARATVQLLWNTAVLAETEATPGGSWSIQLESFSGPKLLQARVRDAAGNIGGLSPVRAFTVDADHPSLTITEPPHGRIFLPTQTPTIRGTARDNLGVLAIELHFFDLLARDVLIRNATCLACPSGTDVEWSFSYDLPPGPYQVKAWAVDRAGNRSLVAKTTYIDL